MPGMTRLWAACGMPGCICICGKPAGPTVELKGSEVWTTGFRAPTPAQLNSTSASQGLDTVTLQLFQSGRQSPTNAVAVYLGMRFATLMIFLVAALAIFVPKHGLTAAALKPIVAMGGIGFYLPAMILWYLRKKRQEEIFLTLPDALDLLVVGVESGLGLDAAMRKVCDEMKDHAKVLSQELSLANFQLQMGRPRREVLHDLGVRTGVDDVRSLAAILIQADRFGSSIAQALRVQSDSMRTRRRQIAEEKAAKTAVQLIFPLVLFIFPGVFVVLVGPAAIAIMRSASRWDCSRPESAWTALGATKWTAPKCILLPG